MKQLLLILGLSCAFCALPSLADDTPTPKPAAAAVAAKMSGVPRVRVVTNMGDFTIELNPERAPLTVQHFLAYVDDGFYSNTVFHRVVPDFVIQGGGLDANYNLKAAGLKVVNEAGNGLPNVRGTVGAARGNDPHSSDAQFYVNLSDNNSLDPNPNRWGYAVFGKVTQGMDVVDKIANVQTGSHGPIKQDVPLKPVIIEKVERINGS